MLLWWVQWRQAFCLLALLSLAFLQVFLQSQPEAVTPALPSLEVHWCARLPFAICFNHD